MLTSKYFWLEVSVFQPGCDLFYALFKFWALALLGGCFWTCFGPVAWKPCVGAWTTAFFGCLRPADPFPLFLGPPGDLLLRGFEPLLLRSFEFERLFALGFWFLIVIGAGCSPGKIGCLSASLRNASCSVANVTLFSATRRAALICSLLWLAGKPDMGSALLKFKFSS